MTSARSQDTSTLQLTCPDCGWAGLGIECITEEIAEDVVNRTCPTCGRTLVLGDQVFAWVLEPTRRGAAAGELEAEQTRRERTRSEPPD